MMKDRIMLFIACYLVVVVSGCKDASTALVSNGAGVMSLSMKTISTRTIASRIQVQNTFGSGAVDSIRIIRARFVLENIRFKSSKDSASFRTSPMVVEARLTQTLQEIGVNAIPPDRYHELRFEVHRVERADVAMLTPSVRAEFADFLPGSHRSVIVQGFIYVAGVTGEPFTFRTRLNEEQEFEFEPDLIIDESRNSVNVTMLVDSRTWFRSSDGTTVIDPRDSLNALAIDNNAKSSLRIFEDSDRDGEDDVSGMTLSAGGL